MGEIRRYDTQELQDKKRVYIFKPEASSQGKGILLISKIDELEGKTGILQTYVNNPYLI
jgi:predicted ATP-grasp superfamily ATP-dependent carboligase